jgi:hypothetical protein
MQSLMQSILGQFDANSLGQISNALGVNRQIAGDAIAAALPLLLSALSRNAATPDGSQSLHTALAQDHQGGILEDLGAFLNGASQGPGTGILGHIFGGAQPGVTNALSRATGMDASSIGRLLVMLAPIVMGSLGRQRAQQGMGPSDLSSMLGGANAAAFQSQPDLMGTLSRFLDQNGDGSVVDELGSILGSLLSRR